MKVKKALRSWMELNGRRLDCGPYLSGAIEARAALDKLPVRKELLRGLTRAGIAGIYNGPQFVRNYVDDLEHGVPFLRTTSLLQADLSTLPLLSRKNAYSPKLRHLRVEEGMTLITCSGTIGRSVYARSDMDGMWSNQDIMKIVPDEGKIPPGYLYAYLSSRFGVPLVVSGTYGAIIQHIEPYHIADLPVPLLGDELQAAVHELVKKASRNRTDACILLKSADQLLTECLGILPSGKSKRTGVSCGTQGSSNLLDRMDAFYFDPKNTRSRDIYDKVGKRFGEVAISDIAEVFIPSIFKRIFVEDPSFGYPYLTGAELYTLSPKPGRYIARHVAKTYRLIIKPGMILVQDSGQVSGLIGRPVMVGDQLRDFACTNNMVRIVPKVRQDIGYVFAMLANEYGVCLMKREATGSSIPHLEESRIQGIKIPWPSASVRRNIGKLVEKAGRLRDEAIISETKAQKLVESAIEQGAD